jgi:hypothetical protein
MEYPQEPITSPRENETIDREQPEISEAEPTDETQSQVERVAEAQADLDQNAQISESSVEDISEEKQPATEAEVEESVVEMNTGPDIQADETPQVVSEDISPIEEPSDSADSQEEASPDAAPPSD